MELTIISPEKTIFNGTVSMVSVPGKKMPFKILHNHAPIISLLEKGKVVYRIENDNFVLPIEAGVIEVNNNKIMICIEKN